MPAEQTLPFTIKLTESEKAFFAKRGPLPKAWFEGRRSPRSYHRSCAEAKLLPAAGSEELGTKCHLLTRDISDTGLNLLHSEPLEVGQLIEIKLRDVGVRVVEIQWCRQLGDRCYAAGCVFVNA